MPLEAFVGVKKTPVKITDMAEYDDLFFAIENTALD
jgi:hypothetical protein